MTSSDFEEHFRSTPIFEPVTSELEPTNSLADTGLGFLLITITLILLAIAPALVLATWEHLL